MSEVQVLIVEGRKTERDELRALLEDLGHKVEEAETADEARSRLLDGTLPIEVVLISSRVAGVPASPLIQALRRQNAELEYVVTWDDASRADALDYLAAGGVSLARRPYDSTELACAILGAADRRWLRALRTHEEALRAVLASVEPDRLPKAIVTGWAHALRADRAQLLLATGAGLSPVWCFGPGLPADVLGEPSWLASLRAPAICARRDGRPLQGDAVAELGHEIVFPLCVGDRPVGVLWASRALRPFVRREISALETFVSAARTAIENAQYRRQLGMANQLATVGQVAAGVANELRAPLTYLRDSNQLVTEGLTALHAAATSGEALPATLNGLPIAALLEQLVRAAKDAGVGASRLGEIVGDLDALVRSDDTTRLQLDLNEAVRTALRMTEVEVRGRARVICKLGEDVEVVGSRGRLTQVLVNLIVRAAQSLGGERAREGNITVATRRDGARVLVEVSDNGPGMTREAACRLFELDFATREPIKGQGLALHLCQEIARRHGGQLRAWSRLGAGTTLVLELPGEPRTSLQEPQRPTPHA